MFKNPTTNLTDKSYMLVVQYWKWWLVKKKKTLYYFLV